MYKITHYRTLFGLPVAILVNNYHNLKEISHQPYYPSKTLTLKEATGRNCIGAWHIKPKQTTNSTQANNSAGV